MPRPVHFEITAEDPNRAIEFYRTAFGWETAKWDGPMDYWLIKTGSDDQMGINGGLARRQQNAGTINTVGVASIDETLASITANGGTIQMGKMEIPNVGWLAYCLDPEGNLFGVMEPTSPMG